MLPLFWVLALDLIRRFDRLGVPLALAVPVVWVALEYMRMHFPTGYPFLKPLGLYQMIGFGWYFLGYTQHDFRRSSRSRTSAASTRCRSSSPR